MKLQYLGDSKDSFKWDYHHHLVTKLGYASLSIVWMMTPDDRGTHGKTEPDLFPADSGILSLCKQLRASRDFGLVDRLPELMGGRYHVRPFGADRVFVHERRADYYHRLPYGREDQILFLDPDNGFEPPKHPTAKHVLYADISRILDRVSTESVVSVFHHFRHKKFPNDFADIRAKLDPVTSTALYWRSLMFVAVSQSAVAIDNVRQFNADYRTKRPGVVAIP